MQTIYRFCNDRTDRKGMQPVAQSSFRGLSVVGGVGQRDIGDGGISKRLNRFFSQQRMGFDQVLIARHTSEI